MSSSETIKLTTILINSQSSDRNLRIEAESQLRQAEETSFTRFLVELASEIASEDRPSNGRQLAGIVLKNAISGNNPIIDKQKRDKWFTVSCEAAEIIKSSVLNVLSSPCEEARSAACQVIAKIGRLELTSGKWSNLVPGLLEIIANKRFPVFHRKACVVSLGYLCEDLNALAAESGTELLNSSTRNLIMTAVTHSVTDTQVEIIYAGCQAFYHALSMAKCNMRNKEERDFIFHIIGTLLSHQDLEVQHAAWECVIQIAYQHYHEIESYVKEIAQLSIKTIEESITDQVSSSVSNENLLHVSRKQAVALAAIEFWNTIADAEIALSDREIEPSKNFIQQAQNVLLPVLFKAMTKQENDQTDSGEWTLSMAAGTCVSLCAEVLKDDILEPMISFVDQNYSSPNWQNREAAILAYGSIMEGPSTEKMVPLVQTSFAHLCNALSDQSVAVRDTAAWTIGRVSSFHTSCIVSVLGTLEKPGLMCLLLSKLNDEPRVAANVCYAIHEIAVNTKDLRLNRKAKPTVLDQFFPQLADSLLEVALRPNGQESNLRASAFEALIEVIATVSNSDECFPAVDRLFKTITHWLGELSKCAEKPNEEKNQLQGFLCNSLNNLLEKYSTKELICKKEIPSIFTLLFKIIRSSLSMDGDSAQHSDSAISLTASTVAERGESLSGCEEDALLVIGSLMRKLKGHAKKQVLELPPVIIWGLSRPSSVRFCRACVSVVCEMAGFMNIREDSGCIPLCIPLMYDILNNGSAPISLKPPVISAIGDIAVGTGDKFIPFLNSFLEILKHAAQTKLTDGPMHDEWIEYFQELRDSVLETYCSLIHGLKSAPGALQMIEPYLDQWISLVDDILSEEKPQEAYCSLSNQSKAIEVLGDILSCYNHLHKDAKIQKLHETINNKARKEEGLQQPAEYLENVLRALRNKGENAYFITQQDVSKNSASNLWTN